MRKYLLLSLIVFISTPYRGFHAQLEDCLPPRFFGGQSVRVIGSVDAGGLPFRDEIGLSEPVLGSIPLNSVIVSQEMERCVDGRNWYSVLHAQTESESPDTVWVMDGDGLTYWLEPVPGCPASDERIRIFPSPTAYSDGMKVDSIDEMAHSIRFSANFSPYDRSGSEKHYFTFDIDTGRITQTDYWYRDLITREFTDRLGITAQIFGDGEDFSTVYVSPDRTKILYHTTNPQIPDCVHGCGTETLWIVDSDGANPIALSEFYGGIARVVWGEDGKIHLSMYSMVVAGPQFTLTVWADGSGAMYSDELILEERSLPFDYVSNMPVWSPNGEWIAVTMGGDQLYSEGVPATGFILENDGNRYIQLPYNGQAASPIVWLDDETILYPVVGIGWDGEDYGLPSDFYTQDALWEFRLDFETLTYRHAVRLTHSAPSENWYDRILDTAQTHHIVFFAGGAIIYSYNALHIYCFGAG